eukprot:3328519-Rhodomonas_salina.3
MGKEKVITEHGEGEHEDGGEESLDQPRLGLREENARSVRQEEKRMVGGGSGSERGEEGGGRRVTALCIALMAAPSRILAIIQGSKPPLLASQTNTQLREGGRSGILRACELPALRNGPAQRNVRGREESGRKA